MGKAIGKSRNILLVEDEPLLAAMVQDLLHDTGYVVTHADTLQGAMAAVARERFDAAMLDINLGDDEVYPVAEKLRAMEVPFFFASARGAGGLSSAFRHHPIVPKPYRIDQIEALLDAALRGDLPLNDPRGPRSGNGRAHSTAN
ncbi:response regulator [Agrilutibacter solisilvae]|uniref:Response regulator n=1 Tax=Agrilutibacter solisilvae TaxID=2763317 RepID=A0A975AS04_9GAMM|nr:response regulator [Lysobacter solisilvae]QSX77574.1 response regulator [Lysobacter solisilvae]